MPGFTGKIIALDLWGKHDRSMRLTKENKLTLCHHNCPGIDQITT